MNSWKDMVKLEDLPEQYQIIAKTVGLRNMITLAIMLEKIQIYLRQLTHEERNMPLSELSEDYQLCIAAIGREETFKLAEAMRSQVFYMLSVANIFLPAKVRFVKANFTGKNHRILAMKTRLSQAFIYSILSGKKYADIA